jgi:hypothetical protein
MQAWRITTVVSAVCLSIGLGVGGWYVNKGLQHFKSEDRSITVKGLAEQSIKSDYVIWPLQFRRAGNDMNQVRQALSEDRQRVLDFLREHGFKDDELDIQPLAVQDLLAREWSNENVPMRFHGQGTITVKSVNVDTAATAANKIEPLIQAGVPLSIGDGDGPRYQLRGFNEVKITLLEAATKNAIDQAEKFASDARSELGKLKHANQGVIRLLDDDGEDTESGRTINKRLRVVSTFEFALR